jgi:hypothetical protein
VKDWGFREVAARWDQVRLRKTERMRKRVMSATDSEEAAAPLQYVIPVILVLDLLVNWLPSPFPCI